MDIPEADLYAIEDKLNRDQPLSSEEQERWTQIMLIHRVALFEELSTKSVPNPKGVLNELAKLFRVEAICVGLQLMPFHSALKFIAGTSVLTLILVGITCIAEITSVIRHW